MKTSSARRGGRRIRLRPASARPAPKYGRAWLRRRVPGADAIPRTREAGRQIERRRVAFEEDERRGAFVERLERPVDERAEVPQRRVRSPERFEELVA